jgi:response regulator of citrate/malate metabolism
LSSKAPVLIIEDSLAVGMLLSEFLKKLGYADIRSATMGQEGVSLFKEAANAGENPLIFLDYNLPDCTANSVMSRILTIKPYTKIIIETANSKEDDSIKEVIGLGAYHYIQKPIRFHEIEEIIKILEEEEAFLEKETDQVKELKNAVKKTEEEITEHIDFVLKSINQISLNKISSILKVSNDLILPYLEKLEQDGKIIKIDDKKEIACNECDSVRTSQIFYCPNCKSSNFKLGKLIEHYDCGNITEENTYADDICPNCKKEIKALGVDYRVMQNHYICNNCEEFFPEISIEYLCLNCENKFKIDNARWKSSTNYKVVSK